MTAVNAKFSDEYFELYCRYLNARHSDSSMANPDKDDFTQFLYSDWSNTQFLELRLNGKLIAVAVTDIMSDGLSAVYSFFAPEMKNRSLGTYCILQQIDYAKQKGLNFIYLGYWIENHNKMHYKSSFKPLQLYIKQQWRAAE